MATALGARLGALYVIFKIGAILKAAGTQAANPARLAAIALVGVGIAPVFKLYLQWRSS